MNPVQSIVNLHLIPGFLPHCFSQLLRGGEWRSKRALSIGVGPIFRDFPRLSLEIQSKTYDYYGYRIEGAPYSKE
jgi:hypothetical protein